jgi:hypothetical protein
MRKRSENVGVGSFVRSINNERRANDLRNNRDEEINLCKILGNKNRKTKNSNSIKFEEKYYPERYS